jgi:transposase
MQVTTIGLDLAKSVFQVHNVDGVGRTVLKRRLRRSKLLEFFAKLSPCLVGLEACGGAHRWAREIAAVGHEVRLMPARYVRPYAKRNKNDAADAEAICEAVTRPSMRFVPIKGVDQQAVLLLHRARELRDGPTSWPAQAAMPNRRLMNRASLLPPTASIQNLNWPFLNIRITSES